MNSIGSLGDTVSRVPTLGEVVAPAGRRPTRRTAATSSVDLAARWVGILTIPPITSVASLLVVTAAAGDPSAWHWALFCLVAAVVLPLAYLSLLLRTGHVSDFQIKKRRQRLRPMLTCLGAIGLALLVMAVGAAPRLLVVLGAAALLQTAALCLVTLRWKISAHTTSMAALAAVLWLVVGEPAGWIAVLVVVVVAWSRVRLGRHTARQTLAGAALGAGIVMAALTLWP